MKNIPNTSHYPIKNTIINLTVIWFILILVFHFTATEIMGETLFQIKFLFIYFFLTGFGILNFKMIIYYLSKEKYSYHYFYGQKKHRSKTFFKSIENIYLTIQHFPHKISS